MNKQYTRENRLKQKEMQHRLEQRRMLHLRIFIGVIAGLVVLAIIILISVTIRNHRKTVRDAELTESASDIEYADSTLGETETVPSSSDSDETVEETPSPTPTSAPTPTPEETEDHSYTITLKAVGDNLYHWSISYLGDHGDGTYNYDWVYDNIRGEIENATFAIVNQEVPMGGAELGYQTYPNFNVVYEVADALVNAGFDCFTLATNHALDQERTGVDNELAYMKANHPQILLTGVYASQEERDTIPIFEYDGFRFAILNYTYSTNGHSSSDTYLVNMLDRDLMAKDIQAAREQADFVIVCPHWGTEGSMELDSTQIELTQFFAEQGVDLVIGNHPHVVQEWTCVTNSLGNPMYVYYSLGNFVSLQNYTERMLGGIADITLRLDPDDHTISYEDTALDFCVTYFTYDPDIPAYHDVSIYPWENFTYDLANSHGISYFDSSFSYERLQELVSQYREMVK